MKVAAAFLVLVSGVREGRTLVVAPLGVTQCTRHSGGRTSMSEAPKSGAATDFKRRRRPVSESHKAFLEEAEKNREAAKERRLKGAGKFWRKKKVYDFVREKQTEKRREAVKATRWPRNVTSPLATLEAGMWLPGRVRNLQEFGAWVDIGAERDGLLHVRDMDDGFTPRASDVVSTGDVLNVTVKFVDKSRGTLALSLVPLRAAPSPAGDAGPLEEIEEGDELWGEVTKVTNFGAFVEVGAEVEGFLHIVEHEESVRGDPPCNFFRRGQRLRTYALEVDLDLKRLKLTTRRPADLPRVGSRGGSGGYVASYEREEGADLFD